VLLSHATCHVPTGGSHTQGRALTVLHRVRRRTEPRKLRNSQMLTCDYEMQVLTGYMSGAAAEGSIQLRPLHKQMKARISFTRVWYEEKLRLRKYSISGLLRIYAFTVTPQANQFSFWNASCVPTCMVTYQMCM
jgi:hypothetical protein